MILLGLDFELGSLRERMAINALRRRAGIEWLRTSSLISAIITFSENGSGKFEPIKENMDSLAVMLMPEKAEELELKSERFKKMLSEEAKKGPIKIRTNRKRRQSRMQGTRR